MWPASPHWQLWRLDGAEAETQRSCSSPASEHAQSFTTEWKPRLVTVMLSRLPWLIQQDNYATKIVCGESGCDNWSGEQSPERRGGPWREDGAAKRIACKIKVGSCFDGPGYIPCGFIFGWSLSAPGPLTCAPLGYSTERTSMGRGQILPPPPLPPDSWTSGRGEATIESSQRASTFWQIKKIEKVTSQAKARPKVNIVIFCLIDYRDGTNDSCEPKLC